MSRNTGASRTETMLQLKVSGGGEKQVTESGRAKTGPIRELRPQCS
jgi:hypothetical protein